MESRAGRSVRGWIVAVVATFIAAVSHGIADGAFPSLLGLGACLVLAGAACTILTPRGQSLWRLATAVAITQVAFHALFSTFGTGAVADTEAHHGGHGSATLDSTLAEAASAPHSHGSMVLAHIAAGILTLILLRNAESAAVGLVRIVRLAVRRLLRPVDPPAPAPAPASTAPATTCLPTLQSLRALSPDRYRGPPVFAPAV